MENTIGQFKSRCNEIRLYINYIIDIDQRDKYIASYNNKAYEKEKNDELNKSNKSGLHINEEVKKILKANTYILLYNLVENTVTNVFQAIYDHLKSKNVTYEEIISDLQEQILNNFKSYLNKKTAKDFNKEVKNFSKDIIHATFNKKDSFSGNIDAKKIKELVQKFGFEVKAKKNAHNGVTLLSIKSKRNELAHGETSFCDCGKDISARELKCIYLRTRSYLYSLVVSCERYITEEKYKKQN